MNKYFVKGLIFNISEVLFIGIVGIALAIPINYIIMLFLLFFISRFAFGAPKHYKKWYLCAIWSFSIFFTLYLILKADILLSILSTIFCGYILSGKGNIEDCFMFKPKGESKYKPLDDFILYNYDDPRLLKYENYLKANDALRYNIYYLRFREKLSWEDIKEQTNIYDQKRLNSILDGIYETLKYNLNLK